MKSEQRMKAVLRAVCSYLSFFLLVGFVVTCCMTLFLNVLADSLKVEFTDDNIALAAKLTFGNAMLISLIFTVVDTVRRRITVDRPVKKISEAADKMIKGDFSVRLSTVSPMFAYDGFNDIISCINKMAEELSGVETLRTDFIYNVSHEMKTPLAVIQNYGKLLGSTDLSEEQRIEYSGAITDATRRLSDMMTNILKLNRLENQKIYPKCESYDLSEQLCECLLQYESVWEKKGIEIETELEELNISADRELLSLVWNNLFSNAFKFTDEGGKVTVSLGAEGDFAVVRITDTGCGMTPEIGAHIFEKFYQGDSSRATQGNGLGLALVKRVVDITRGEIAVESAPGEGTAFTVRIRREGNEQFLENR